MSQASRVLNEALSGINYDSALENALAAIDTCHSGSTAPTDELTDGKFWLDTSTPSAPILKIYGLSGWHSIMTFTTSSVANRAVSGTLSVTGTSSFTGDMTAGTIDATTLNTTSDVRLKSEFKHIDDALSKVLSLTGLTYKFQKELDRKAGLIAQEVEDILPEAVHTRPSDGIKSIEYGAVIALLVEGMKDMESQILNLNDRLSAIEQVLDDGLSDEDMASTTDDGGDAGDPVQSSDPEDA